MSRQGGEGWGWFLSKAACKVTHGSNGAHGSGPCYDPDILFRFETNRSFDRHARSYFTFYRSKTGRVALRCRSCSTNRVPKCDAVHGSEGGRSAVSRLARRRRLPFPPSLVDRRAFRLIDTLGSCRLTIDRPSKEFGHLRFPIVCKICSSDGGREEKTTKESMGTKWKFVGKGDQRRNNEVISGGRGLGWKEEGWRA